MVFVWETRKPCLRQLAILRLWLVCSQYVGVSFSRTPPPVSFWLRETHNRIEFRRLLPTGGPLALVAGPSQQRSSAFWLEGPDADMALVWYGVVCLFACLACFASLAWLGWLGLLARWLAACCLLACLPACLVIWLFVCLSRFCMCICLVVCLSHHLPVYLAVCPVQSCPALSCPALFVCRLPVW